MNQIISLRVLALIERGESPTNALRSVCGAKVVDQMIDELYTTLRTKAASK